MYEIQSPLVTQEIMNTFLILIIKTIVTNKYP